MTNSISKFPYYVTMTDKTFSGWGCAEDKIMKRVICCSSRSEAMTIYDNMTTKAAYKNGFRRVNVCVNCPAYSSSRYLVEFYSCKIGAGLYGWGDVIYKNF